MRHKETPKLAWRIFSWTENYEEMDLVMLTEKGIIKRLDAKELNGLGNRGLVLVKLKEKDLPCLN